MSWGERSFFFQGAGSKDPPPQWGVGWGWGAIINVSDQQSRFVLCGLVNKSLFYQAN